MRKGLFGILVGVIFPLTLLAQVQQGDSTLLYEIKANTDVMSTTLQSDLQHIKKVVFWYSSPGNVSQSLSLYLEAPPTAKAKISVASLGTSTKDSVLGNPKLWSAVKFRTSGSTLRSTYTFEEPNVLLNAKSPEISAAIVILDCSKLTQSSVNDLLASSGSLRKKKLTQAELCGTTVPRQDGSGSGTTIGEGNANTIVSAVLSKDTCQDAKKSAYLVAVEFDISAINASAYDKGVTLAMNVKSLPYKGEDSASIKPRSEGMYAPDPLLLMATTGGCGYNEKMRLVRWKNGKISSTKDIKIVKCVLHFENLYTTGLIKGLLNGGKGVFELSSEEQTYSVCFNLKRVRQRVNGYR